FGDPDTRAPPALAAPVRGAGRGVVGRAAIPSCSPLPSGSPLRVSSGAGRGCYDNFRVWTSLVLPEGLLMQGYAPLDPSASVLPDHRLLQRLEFMVQTFAEQPERSIPQATGNRNDMDAAYDFFKNPRVLPAR